MNLKNLTSTVILLLFCSIISIAQDTIYKVDNTIIEAKVLEITTDEIKFKKFNYQEGPTFTFSKIEVVMIVFANGEKEIFTDFVEQKNSQNVLLNKTVQEKYLLGMKDAAINYRSYKPFWGTFVPTVIFSPAGLVAGIIIGSSKPKPQYTNPDPLLIQDKIYYNGYTKTMKRKKWGRVWGGFGTGIAVNVITYLILTN